MADDKPSDAEKAELAKIKELEESLARELDQQINLSRPTDSRIEGNVDVNLQAKPDVAVKPQPVAMEMPPDVDPVMPPEEVKTYESIPKAREPDPVAEPEKPKVEPGEVSLEDLDALLAQEAPDLKEEIENLKKAGEDPQAKNADLSSSDVDESAVHVHHDPSEDIPRKLTLRELVLAGLKRFANRILDFLYMAPIHGFKYLTKYFKETLPMMIAGQFQILRHRWGKVRQFLGLLKPIQWLTLLAMTMTVGFIGYVLLGPNIKFNFGFKFHPGFAQASFDERHSFAVDKEFVPISEEGEYPQFVFLLDKVIVNIQPSESSTKNPMIAMRLFFESNSRQGTVEIKDREKEIRDLTQRVLETFTYDRIITARGKMEFKEQLRREATSVMNTGIIKNVYIDDMLIKP